MTDPVGFATPQEAIEAVCAMLRARDWAGLARCHDLEGSGVDRAELESGRYFIREGSGHPSGADRWRPFSPSFRYEHHEERGDEATVWVFLAIDQGDGMIQRSVKSVELRRRDGRWLVRP